MSGMLRAARAKFASSAAPSIISALVRPSLANCCCSALVLASCAAAASRTTIPPSLALADSACLSASARTFLGRSMAWLRTTGPNERPPPRNRFTRADPCRADPVPFCRYIFLPVRAISARCLTAWVPARRLASCHNTQRCTMSGRASRPKMASGSSTDPAAVPSSMVTVISMSRPLARAGIGRGLPLPGGSFRQSKFARLRRLLGQCFLDRVAQHDPTAFVARHRALDQHQAALDVGLHHFQIERGDTLDAHVPGHLLVLEGLAGVLAAAGRTVRTVRDGHAVRSA